MDKANDFFVFSPDVNEIITSARVQLRIKLNLVFYGWHKFMRKRSYPQILTYVKQLANQPTKLHFIFKDP